MNNGLKKIGEGLYYDVYQLSDSRVLKKEKSYWRKQLTYLKWGMFSCFFRDLLHPNIFKRSLDDSKRFAAQGKELFGNTVFHDGYECEQDMVMTLEDYFRTCSDAEKKETLEKYIALTYALWERGFSDVVFNFLRNNGITRKGEVILCDFNEVTFDKHAVARAIRNKPWLKPWMYRVMRGPFKRHVRTRLDEAFTIPELNKYWNDNPN